MQYLSKYLLVGLKWEVLAFSSYCVYVGLPWPEEMYSYIIYKFKPISPYLFWEPFLGPGGRFLGFLHIEDDAQYRTER